MALVVEKNKVKKYVPEGESELIIPEGVKSIGGNVFANCDNICSVIFPETLTELGQRSFAKCHNLKSVRLPESVKKIANYAFYECSGLESVILADTMEKIGDSAFSGCKMLNYVKMPEQVDSIGKYAFFNCDSLADENGYVIVNKKLYTYCGGDDILKVPDGVELIEDRAFESKIVEMTCIGERREIRNVRSIYLPETVRYLGEYTFAGCTMYKLVALGIDISSLSTPELKQKAVIGFMNDVELFKNQYIMRENIEYIVRQKLRYLPFFFQYDLVDGLRYIAEAGKINLKDFDDVYLIPAQKANAVQCCAFLLEWRSHN